VKKVRPKSACLKPASNPSTEKENQGQSGHRSELSRENHATSTNSNNFAEPSTSISADKEGCQIQVFYNINFLSLFLILG